MSKPAWSQYPSRSLAETLRAQGPELVAEIATTSGQSPEDAHRELERISQHLEGDSGRAWSAMCDLRIPHTNAAELRGVLLHGVPAAGLGYWAYASGVPPEGLYPLLAILFGSMELTVRPMARLFQMFPAAVGMNPTRAAALDTVDQVLKDSTESS